MVGRSGHYDHLRVARASRHVSFGGDSQRPDLPRHSSLAATGLGSMLTAGHSRSALARLTAGCDAAEASRRRGHGDAHRLTFAAPNP
jgi:hypothetical protein